MLLDWQDICKVNFPFSFLVSASCSARVLVQGHGTGKMDSLGSRDLSEFNDLVRVVILDCFDHQSQLRTGALNCFDHQSQLPTTALDNLKSEVPNPQALKSTSFAPALASF